MDKFHLFCNKNIATSLFSRCNAIFHGVCPLLFNVFVFTRVKSKYCKNRLRLWTAIKCSTVSPSWFGDVRCTSSLRTKSAKNNRLSAITQTCNGVFPLPSSMSAVLRVAVVVMVVVLLMVLFSLLFSTLKKTKLKRSYFNNFISLLVSLNLIMKSETVLFK